LIEVLISAVLVALIVIATFTGFDVSNRATADERAHAQADVLAQQDEDRLRSLQINQLSGLSETRTATYNGTVYTITSTGEFLADSTETVSCVKEAQSASYVRTTSKVTWTALGTRPAVVETGLITPPIGGELLVQVFDGKGNGVPGMTVQATGPSPSTAVVNATTGSNGCVIFAAMKEGEYNVNTFQTGYVDKDGNSEPPISQRTVSVTTGATTKKSFQFAKGGALSVNFVSNTGAASEGDIFVAYNTNMTIPSIRTFGTIGTFAGNVTTPKTLFPFGEPSPPAPEPISPYTVYAGSCAANKPSTNGGTDPSVNVTPGETASINVVVPPINIQVWSGKSSSEPGTQVTSFSGTITDEGCENKVRSFSTTSATNGELHKPMPFGSKYKLCVASNAKVGTPTAKYKKLKNVAILNNKPEGTSLQAIYLGSGEEQTGSAYTCP
jgi:Tfp pilus assembly protein PilV